MLRHLGLVEKLLSAEDLRDECFFVALIVWRDLQGVGATRGQLMEGQRSSWARATDARRSAERGTSVKHFPRLATKARRSWFRRRARPCCRLPVRLQRRELCFIELRGGHRLVHRVGPYLRLLRRADGQEDLHAPGSRHRRLLPANQPHAEGVSAHHPWTRAAGGRPWDTIQYECSYGTQTNK